ncbi:hypothetical protein N6H18_13200 [Reichenbachiella agarivorans]|uniref:DUF4905 domain-containing protein n=1 Tax=Reichenbachiella agarivorans TaxID=2979464 RepID=A0ABY6CSP5_9BACT|nr:hypothetical protein [Reichenbachiella agarivorans]UXP31305.1 hypothetical protein N6H18_13200 [Reichenbachiella agarivorans]
MSSATNLTPLELELPGPILYLQPDAEGRQLLIEFLHHDLPAFYLIDLDQKEITNELTVTTEYKNIVLKDFGEDYVLTQRFSDQNNPNSVEIFCFRWGAAEPYITLTHSQILDHGDHWIKVPHSMFVGKTVTIDLNTGASTENEYEPIPPSSDVRYPIAYSNETPYFSWFEKLLKRLGHTPVKSCEYLKQGNTILISYYVIENQKVSNHLVILDSKGEVLDRYLLAEGLKGIGKYTFFICHNHLIFITGKQTLNVIEL